MRLEQLNKISKEQIIALGFHYINNKSAEETTKSIGATENIIKGTRMDFDLKRRTGDHSNQRNHGIFNTSLEQVHHKTATFNHTPRREYKAFTKLQRNIFLDIKQISTHRWIKKKKKKEMA